MEARGKGNSGIEENTLAILDTSGFSKANQYINDDNIAFLEAVRSSSIIQENGTAPTSKMYEAIFQILRNGNSLDLIMASYQLLTDLEKRFPRVHLSEIRKAESPSSTAAELELVVVEEAWSPFTFGLDAASSVEARKISAGSLDPYGFHLLIEDLAEVWKGKNAKALETKSLRNMFLLQYIVIVLEGDFWPRNEMYKENTNWAILRESLLNMILGSRRITYKSLIKDFMYILSELSLVHTDYHHDTKCLDGSSESPKNSEAALTLALYEVEKCTCLALQKLLVMVMELDKSKKMADMEGVTTRADGVRTPGVEIILDELTYNSEILSSFFQAFDEPRWKLEIIVQYFGKYITKPTTRTRRSNGANDDVTFEGILKSLSNINSTKSLVKKISTEVAQLLLGHAFQAYLSLSLQNSAESISDLEVETCNNLISAFTCLAKIDERAEISPFAKEALFTASTILSTKS